MKHVYAGVGAALIILGLFSYKTFEDSAPKLVQEASTAEFGGVSLSLEFATTTASREQGLSGRSDVPDGYGMLFAFAEEDYYGFWMKDTLVPLDIFWLDSKGQVVHIEADVATSSYPHVFYPLVPARYVLETAAGFTRAHAIATGTQLRLQKFPTVSE
jgi:uncharacterized protein